VKISSIITILFCLTLLSACATFDDVEFDKRAAQQIDKLASANVINIEVATTKLPQILNISEIDHLITTAMLNNPNLQQTLLTLKIAHQQSTSTNAAKWPSLTGNLSANKQQNNQLAYSPSLDINWTVDLWQQLSNASDAQQANVLASSFAYQGAKDLLAANLMKAYLGLVQYAQLVDIEKMRVDKLKTNEKIIVSRYQKGLIDLKDLDTAKSSTQSSQATLIDYQAQYQQALRQLSLLTGLTSNKLTYQNKYPAITLPASDIDLSDIGRRPDLQQAYQGIIASQLQHKVAYKALLPSFSLTGSISNTNSNLHDALFGSSAWQLLGRLSAPIFNAGKLTSEVEVAKLNAKKSYWAFQQTLLTAINETHNALANEQSITQRLLFTQQSLISAKRSEQTTLSRYRQGTVSLLDLLQVQQQTFSLQAQVTQLTYQQLTNRITLGLAVGLGV